MKTRWMVTILLIAGISLIAGCAKEEPKEAPVTDADQETTGMIDSMKTAADETVQKTTAAVKEAFTSNIDLNKTVSDLKAEAAKMDVESLTSVAMKYRDAIVEKQNALKPLMEKLAAIPMTEKLGTEAQTLTAELTKLSEAIAPLQERLTVYIDAIKAKGGDVKNLML